MEGVYFVGQSQAHLCGWTTVQSQGLQVSDEPNSVDGLMVPLPELLLLSAGAFEVWPAERSKQPHKI